MRRPFAMTAAVLFVIMTWCTDGFALNPDLDISQYAHTTWGVRDGLAKGTTWAVAQTPDGYLWLGTEFGLLRFDGVKSVPWQPPADEGLPSSIIVRLFVARDGTLWIGTHKGLASWKNGKLIRYPELDGQEVSAVIEDRQGTLWISSWGSSTGRLCSIYGGRATCRGEDGSFGLGLYSLYEDNRGNVWAGGTTGVWRCKPGPPKFYPIPDRAREISVTSLNEGEGGAILIITPDGIFQLVNGRVEEYRPPGNAQHFTPKKSLRDRNGGIWLGTMGQGLLHIHQGRADVYAKSDGLSGDYISALFEDREGNIWIGTTGGLDRFNGFTVPTISAKQCLSNTNVWSVLAARDGSIWLGTSEGVNRWKDGQITVYHGRSAPQTANLGRPGAVSEITDSGLPDDGIDSLYQDEEGRIWVSTLRGIAYFEHGRFIPTTGLPRGAVHSMVGNSAGNLWVAFSQFGLFHLLGGTVVERIPWAKLGHSGFALALLPDSIHGGLWLGFAGGGIAYFKDGQVRAQFTEADGLGHGAVRNLQLDKDGVLWAATEGGLSRLENGRVATLTSQNGLPCETVHWMMQDDAGSFWMHMNCGLVRIAPNELRAWVSSPKRRIHAKVFDSSDGVMIRATVSAFSPLVTKSKDGKLWFADSDGAGVIDPGHMSFNRTPPPVYIEQVSADGKTFDASENLHLPPRLHNLEIDYTALSFVTAEKVFFRYKLEGVDPDWQDVRTRRQAFYNNLAPGNYHFRVIACNNDGVWNETGDHLDFSITAAWFQTNLFRGSCVFAFALLLWMLYRLRVRSIELRSKQLASINTKLETQIAENGALLTDLQLQVGLLQHLPVSAWTLKPDGTVDFVNQVWLEFAGQTPDFVQSHPEAWMTAVHPEDREIAAKSFWEGVHSGQGFASETRSLRAQDGTYRWHLQQAVVLHDADGKVLKFVGTTTDIDDQKRTEEALRQAQGDLARINRVTTMGELAASLAHELSQPISGAITNTDVCLRKLGRDKPDLDELRVAVNRIGRDARRAAEIIGRIRSQFEKGSSNRETLGVNEIVRETVALLRDEAMRYNISVRTELATDLPQIVGDRVQLQQVAMNLIVNSIEAMKDVHGIREMVIKSQRAENGQILVTVSDTGVGLPQQLAEQIFDPFFTTKPHGTGMGLRISRSIVESHGGRLWAEGTGRCGATFHVTLPAEIPAK